MIIGPKLRQQLNVSQMIRLEQYFDIGEGFLDINDQGDLYTIDSSTNYLPLSDADNDFVHSLMNSAEVKLGSFAKIKNCQDKPQMHLIPLNVIKEVAMVLTTNFNKYGEDWKDIPNAKNIFLDSMLRHLEAWQSGQRYDEDNTLHIIKVVSNAIFIAWHELREVSGGKPENTGR